jgi:hypothetical protein
MRLRHVRFSVLGFLVSLLLLCFGCGTEKGTTQAKRPPERLSPEEKSRQDWDERIVDTPWLVSSDYFRQKEAGKSIDLGKWWESRKALEVKQEETEERLVQLEEAVRKKKAGFSEMLRLKVALVILPGVYQAAPDMKETLLKAIRSQFAGHPRILLVGPDEVEDILVQQGLDVSSENMAKTARALGMYPAARLVVFVDKVALHRKGEGFKGRIDYTTLDGFSGTSVTQDEEVGSVPSGPDGESRLLQQLAARIALTLEKRAAQYPWVSRVAMLEGKNVYVSAGRASGLKPGDILAVYGPGREIIHPVANVSMGFKRGPYKGTVKVLKLLGRDAAEATLVAGEGKIEVDDLLALPDKAN